MKNIAMFLLFSVLVLGGNAVFAEEAAKEEAIKELEPEDHVYHYPEIETEYFGLLGYRYVSKSGSSAKSREFDYLHSSAPFGADIKAFPFPHRFHLEADVLNKKDYFTDLGYAYKDMILFRSVHRSLYHNLDRINLLGLNREERDTNKIYGVTVDMKNMFLRFKTPDFPLHIYIDSRFMNKYGSKQQIFDGDSGAVATKRRRISEVRYLDWNIKDITLGTNVHLGPVEVDISHGEERFTVKGDKMPSYAYTNATSPVRAAGTYPHNLIPDIKSSTSTLKLHTSYTGRLVASTTLSKTNKENKDSGAKADYMYGSVDVVYIPLQMLNFVGRYRHKETELENPTSLPSRYLGFASYTTALTGIRHSLSSQTDTFTGIMRFRPISKLGITAEYTYEEIERENSDEWLMSNKTTRKNFSLSAHARPYKKLTLKAKYVHQDIGNPAHNTQPDKSDSESFSLNWLPLNWLNTMFSYNTVKEKKQGLHYVTSAPAYSTVGAQNRTANRDRFLGSITFMMDKKFSITPSYAYMHNKIKQDLSYINTTGVPQLDRDVPYKDTAHSYALGVNYLPKKDITLNADASYTKGKGGFNPAHPNALSTENMASFSNLKIRELAYSLGSEYRLKHDWTLGLKGSYSSFKDMIDNVYDDNSNGIVRIVMLTVSKKW